ncbi:MAG: sporulation protein [Burkholderiales bacterium PBB1]|nr:MAG: sporulation protein [Burkholderiales bacterium PBB1]
MALPEFLKRKPADDAGSASSGRSAGSLDAVEKVRTRTRQRLIGAVLLLTLGVIGFPLLFESQPRPIPVDIPIEIPKPDGAPALPLPAARSDAAATSESTVASGVVTRDAPSQPMPAAETAAAVPASVPAAVPAPPPASPTAVTSDKPAAPTTAAPAASVAKLAAAVAKTPAGQPATSDTAPSKAASAADGAARFVVQVGAFADPASAREVRLKMEKLGMKTYTQVAETAAGKRIRVRLGPFATRAEADKAQAKSKEAGIAAVVLTL